MKFSIKMSNQTKYKLVFLLAGFLLLLLSLKVNVALTLIQRNNQVIPFGLDDIYDHSPREIVDVISVGSMLQVELQDAQQRTFGSHEAVRNLYRLTELNDTDQNCFKTLTMEQVHEVASFCKNATANSGLTSLLRKQLFFEKKSVGWACAQKRPIDGLYSVLMKYRNGDVALPHYLVIIDDDTYLNIDSINDILYNNFPQDAPHVIAGCDVFGAMRYKMNFPVGGFGSFLSRAAIERLLKPIDCNDKNADGVINDSFTRFACWRLQQNHMGENLFFTDGMSVMDLLYKYAAVHPFAEVRNWKVGFCFHSDIAMAFFFNMYHIAVPDSELEANVRLTDSLRKEYRYTSLTNTSGFRQRGECDNKKEKCSAESPVCHYIQADQMDRLFHAQLQGQTN
jgi:hypothetical protein